MQPKYKRVLIKLSGEALATANGSGIDYSKLSAVCDQIIEVKNLGVEKTAMLVVKGDDEGLKRATGNIKELTLAPSELINVYDVVRVGKCIFTLDAIKAIEEVYGNE